ncbi:MAG: glycine cleavage system aminomethyltransferase GcvT [Betaproteobacteria bacterium]|nr:glycine cleavage system aminomethyltransferase GcvT [Betaproteobacteria bacterium]
MTDTPAAAAPARVPLDALHRRLGARMGAFAGWDMPIQYPAGLKAEHLHTRSQAGLFDVSHMGQLRITPRDGQAATLRAALEAALPVDFDDWPVGQQRYSLLLNAQGGIEDDLMMVNLGDQVRMVVNAGNREADLARLRALCPTLAIDWIDEALIALQGPQAEAALARLDPAAAGLRFMGAATLTLLGAACFTTRSGYTGEDGYEIALPLAQAQAVVERLLADPAVAPVGLGARDTLRLEAGLPLHGNDIGPGVTPVEAGLAFAIARSRRRGAARAGGFPGAERILAQLADGAPRRLVGLVSDQPAPIRAHAPILDAEGVTVGEVTSGTVSPSLGRPVMLALVAREALQAGGALQALVRERRLAVSVAALPFMPKRYRR